MWESRPLSSCGSLAIKGLGSLCFQLLEGKGSCFCYSSRERTHLTSAYVLLVRNEHGQKLFILMRSHLYILSFMSLALGDISVKILLCGISKIFLPMFSSRTIMVLQLIFKSFIYLEFIYVYGANWWSSFIFLHAAV